MHTRESLARDLRSLGVGDGDVVMVHASVRAVGAVAGGPDQIHLAIADAVGTSGTLFMYAACPDYVDEVGRGDLSPELERELLEAFPAFDALTARSARDNGALVEMLRTWPGTRVNLHPARFAVRGAHADHLLSEQPWDFAFGHGSLLERFVGLRGKILLLGSDHDAVTFLHYAEHIVDLPDKIVARFLVPIDVDGVRTWRPCAEYDTSTRAHPSWPDRFFAEVVDGFLAKGGGRTGAVGDAPSVLMEAPALLDFALAEMHRTALEWEERGRPAMGA